jgi:hypothetical protein
VSTVHCRVQELLALQENDFIVAWFAESEIAIKALDELRS